jgi:cardiolipin synthase (CMP-forming)
MLDPRDAFLFPPPMAAALSLPNLLTIARILVIPLICWLLIAGGTELRWIAFALYVAAALTDWLDGYLARKMNLGSALGRMLDPIADKLLVGALLVVFAYTRDFSWLDLIPAIAILMREIFVPGLREYLGPRNVVVHVTKLAKWKTTVQLVALAVVMIEPLIPGLGLVSDVVLWAAGILTVWTGVQYFQQTLPHLTENAT